MMYYVEDHHLFLENFGNQLQPRLVLQLNKV
jgi:hypothetical protein